MTYFVYILECADKTYYIGSTNNLERRLHAHNNLKSAARYTKMRRPVVLRYVEQVLSRSIALKRELTLKNLTRKEKSELILSVAT